MGKNKKNIISFIKNINEYYGSDENPSKLIFWNAIGFLCGAFIFITILILNLDKYTTIEKIFLKYIIILFLEMPFIFVSIYFFKKKKDMDKRKISKYSCFILAILLLAITFLPIFIFLLFLHKVKFINMYKYSGLYCFSFIFAIIIDVFFGAILYYFISKCNYLNAFCITLVVVFVLNYLNIRLIGKLYFKYKVWQFKKKCNDDYCNTNILSIEDIKYDSNQFKNELYVLNFVIITFGTLAIYCLNLNYIIEISNPIIMNGIRDNVLYSFALYTTFDQLYDKWKNAFEGKNKNFEI